MIKTEKLTGAVPAATPRTDPTGEMPILRAPVDKDEGIPALELIGVRAAYGKVAVLRGVDLVVPRGTVVALMGPNGAGKTTVLNLAAGFVRATAGCVHVAGLHINGVAPAEIARAGVCSIPEGRGAFPNLTVRENLIVFTRANNKPIDQFEEITYRTFPRLGERRHQRVGTLSGGERQMLSMSRAFACEPAILLLDEISMGLAPIVVEELYEKVGELASMGIAILLVEQFATSALKVATTAAILRQGRIEIFGSPDLVAGELTAAYLGATA